VDQTAGMEMVNTSLLLLGIEPRFLRRLDGYLVTIATELSRLLLFTCRTKYPELHGSDSLT
jgi:hypothetical protein